MSSDNKTLRLINYIVVILLLATLALAVNFFIQSQSGLGTTFSGMFILFTLLYWKYGRSYLEVNSQRVDNT